MINRNKLIKQILKEIEVKGGLTAIQNDVAYLQKLYEEKGIDVSDLIIAKQEAEINGLKTTKKINNGSRIN